MTDFEVPETHDTLEGISPPQLTRSVAGHGEVLDFLAGAASSGKLHHAMIFEGERGIGKATAAFHLASGLLSGHFAHSTQFPQPDPESAAYRQIAQGSHPGLLYLTRPRNQQGTGFKQAITVDEIRRLQRFFGMTAADSHSHRIVIIDAANDMNRNAANALLKMLEEPPARALFILVAHGSAALLPTIRSRCQLLKFTPLSTAEIAAIIRRHMGEAFDPAAIDRIAALGKGSARRALVFAQFGGLDLMEALNEYLDAARPDRVQAHKLAEIAGGRGSDIHRDILRELLLDRMRTSAVAAAGRGDLRAADRIAAADMAIQERMRVADAYNLDRKQEFLTLLSDVHEILAPVAAG